MSTQKNKYLRAFAIATAVSATLGLTTLTGVFNDTNDNEDIKSSPETVLVVPDVETKKEITSYDILKQYLDETKERHRMMLLNPDGERGMFEVDQNTGMPVTNRGRVYKQILDIAEQLVEDGVDSPESILSAAEALLQGENPFMQPHTSHTHGDKDHQHYTFVTPFPKSNTSHAMEQTVSSVFDPSVVLISPYSSRSYEVFVGFHEMGHAIDFMLSRQENGKTSHRQRLMYEATADCFAMLLYERAGLDHPEHLDGLDGEFMQRIADLRTISELQMILNAGDATGTKQYFNHPYMDGFVDIVEQMKQDGVLETMSVEDMLVMSQDYVLNLSDLKITEDYVNEVTTQLMKDRSDLFPLPFDEQLSEIKIRLENGRYEGPSREFYQRYVKAADRILDAQPNNPELMRSQWEAQIRQTDEHKINFQNAWSMETDLIQRQLSTLYRKVSWERDRNGHEAAKKLFDRLMFGTEQEKGFSFADRLKIWAEMADEAEFEKDINLDRLTTPPPAIVSMNTIDTIKEMSETILGEHRGNVAIADMGDVFRVENDQLVFDLTKTSPVILRDLAEQLAADETDKVPQILNALKRGATKFATRQSADRFVQTVFWMDPENDHKYAIVCVVPDAMSAHQIEQRFSLSHDPDAAWVSPLRSETLQIFMAMRELATVKHVFENDTTDVFDLKADRVHEVLLNNAALDCFALLACKKAYVENPKALDNPKALINRIADLRDYGVYQTMLVDGNANQALFYDTSPFIRAMEGFIEYGFTKDELKAMSLEDMMSEVETFIKGELRDVSPKDITETYVQMQQLSQTVFAPMLKGSDGFLQQRDILNTYIVPNIHDNNLTDYTRDLIQRMNTASWTVAKYLPPNVLGPAWEREMIGEAATPTDERLLRVVFEQQWLMQQMAMSGRLQPTPAEPPEENNNNNGPQRAAAPQSVLQSLSMGAEADEAPPPPSETGPQVKKRKPSLSFDIRMTVLEKLKQQLQQEAISYTPEEARHILQTYLKETMIKVDGKYLKVEIDPDFVADDGTHITLPKGSVQGIDRPVTITITPEYIASLDPNFERKKANKSEQSQLISIPLPSGKTIDILVSPDMLSDDGTYITLDPDKVPENLGSGDKPIKIFIPSTALEKIPTENSEKPANDNDEDQPIEVPVAPSHSHGFTKPMLGL